MIAHRVNKRDIILIAFVFWPIYYYNTTYNIQYHAMQLRQHDEDAQILNEQNNSPNYRNPTQYVKQLYEQAPLCCKIVLYSVTFAVLGIPIFYAFADKLTDVRNSPVEMTSGPANQSVMLLQMSQSQLQNYLQRLKTPALNKKQSVQSRLADKLYQQPSNPQLLQVQQYYFEKTYKVSHYSQKPMCVVSAGRNLAYQVRYQSYLHSIARLNYTNFKVVLVDDASSDDTLQLIHRYIQILHDRYPHLGLKGKITVVSNKDRLYALKNRDIAIQKYCQQQDIVVQLDADDQFIGTMALSTINAVYSQNPDIWVMYSGYIHWSPQIGQAVEGISQRVPMKVLQQGTYRLTTQYYSSATRTFLRKLYMKIDKADFMDSKGLYYKWTSDLFVHYALVQMAGPKHYQYIHEIFYFYNLEHNNHETIEKKICRLESLALPRYRPLQNLDSQIERIQLSDDTNWIKQQKQILLKQLS